jgi:hypothetical protein
MSGVPQQEQPEMEIYFAIDCTDDVTVGGVPEAIACAGRDYLSADLRGGLYRSFEPIVFAGGAGTWVALVPTDKDSCYISYWSLYYSF